MNADDERLARLCVASGRITAEAADRALVEAAHSGVAVREALIRAGVEAGIVDSLARAARLAPMSEKTVMVSPGKAPGPGTTALPEGAHQLGPYVLQAEIGRGGMGAVYRARHPALGRMVAVKTLLDPGDAESVERFLREAKMAARIPRHPNLVQVHDAGVEDGVHFIVMDFIEGRPLDSLLSAGPLEPRRAAEIVEAIARGLAVAHAEGVVHRDLKPANILVDTHGTPLLTDFGLARDVASPSGLSVSGQIIGTPGSMSPEQASGRPDLVTVRTDVYGLGAVLYQALTGVPPFQGLTAMEVIRAVIDRDPVPPSTHRDGIPPELDVVVLTCLAKSPGERYASASALADDLRRWLDGEGILARPLPWHRRLARRLARRKAVVALVCAAVLFSAWAAVAAIRTRGVRGEKERAGQEAAARDAEAIRRRADARARVDAARPIVDRVWRDLELGARIDTRRELAGPIEALRKAIEIDPASFDAHLQLSRALRLVDDLPAAYAEAAEALRLQPGDAEALWERAIVGIILIHRSGGEMWDFNMSDVRSMGRKRLMRSRSSEGRADPALVAALRADVVSLTQSKLPPAREANVRGLLADLDNDFDAALKAFDEAIAIDAHCIEAIRNRAYLLGTLQRPEALAAFRKLVEILPRDVPGLRYLSRLEDSRDAALAAHARLLALTPEDPSAYTLGVWVRVRFGDDVLAYEESEQLVLRFPEFGTAWNLLQTTASNLGYIARALVAADKYIALTPPGIGYGLLIRAGLRRYLGDFTGSRADLDKALAMEPGNPVYLWGRGRTRVVLGEVSEGVHDMLDAVASGDMDPEGRKVFDLRRKGLESETAKLKTVLDQAKFTERTATQLLFIFSQNATPERREQYEGAADALRDLAMDLYEKAGSWKNAERLIPAAARNNHDPYWAETTEARFASQQGRLADACALLRAARGKGLVSLELVELDERYKALRGSAEFEALKKEAGR